MQSLSNLNSSTPLKFAQLPSTPSLLVKTLPRSPEFMWWVGHVGKPARGWQFCLWDVSLSPFPSKQVASSVIKKKNVAYVLFFLRLLHAEVRHSGFGGPSWSTRILELEKRAWGLFFGFLFLLFNFMCVMTCGGLKKNCEESGLIWRLPAFTGHTLRVAFAT